MGKQVQFYMTHEDEKKETASALDPNLGLERTGPQATIGVGSRQQVHVLQADGTLKAIQVVTGQSDGRLTAVTSRELKPGMKVLPPVPPV